jgi:hypothetical protein
MMQPMIPSALEVTQWLGCRQLQEWTPELGQKQLQRAPLRFFGFLLGCQPEFLRHHSTITNAIKTLKKLFQAAKNCSPN